MTTAGSGLAGRRRVNHFSSMFKVQRSGRSWWTPSFERDLRHPEYQRLLEKAGKFKPVGRRVPRLSPTTAARDF